MERHEGHHGGHGSVSNGLITAIFWYSIATVVGLLGLQNLVRWAHRTTRKQTEWSALGTTQPSNRVSLEYRAAVFLRRHLQSRLEFEGFAQWLAPPPVGKTVILVLYLAACVVLSIYGIQFSGPTYLDSTALRTGWIALTQVPLIILLSARGANPLSGLTGVSYEQIRWAHRWVGQIVLVVSAIHGIFFAVEWSRAGLFWVQWNMMSHAKHGLFATLVLLWMGVSSLLPLRRWSHELFVQQHRVSAVVFLTFLNWHLPQHHKLLVIVSAATLGTVTILDWASFFVVPVLRRQYSWRKGRCSSSSCPTPWRATCQATLTAVGKELTVVEINGYHSTWFSGQHVYLWVPCLWWQTAHPFTITNHSESSQRVACQSIQLILRTKTGFTQALNRLAVRHEQKTMQVFVSEPYGQPPKLDGFETVVLLAASTGASFILPILEDIMHASVPSIRKVYVLLAARDKSHIEVYKRRVLALRGASNASVDLEVCVFHSGSQGVATTGETDGELVRMGPEDETNRLMQGDAAFCVDDSDDESHELPVQYPHAREGGEETNLSDEGTMLGTETPGFLATRTRRNTIQKVPGPINALHLLEGIATGQSLTGRTIAADDELAEDKLKAFSVGRASTDSGLQSDRRRSTEETVCGSVSGLDEEEKIALEGDDFAAGSFELHEVLGRPDLNSYIDTIVSSRRSKVGMIACGGKEFIRGLRTAQGRARGGDLIWFHAEEFEG
ncbi:hypothetical protein GQ53DRAFT_89703 [Thozetella sp. PMI_491]|nr:hypothetical protein GQ53DRAFT_89703 [Thozetella sp. PMI_491]